MNQCAAPLLAAITRRHAILLILSLDVEVQYCASRPCTVFPGNVWRAYVGFQKCAVWSSGEAAVDTCVVRCVCSLAPQEKELAKEMGGLNLTQKTAATGAGGVDGVKKYNKSSFFDEISCDVLDRAEGEMTKTMQGNEATACNSILVL